MKDDRFLFYYKYAITSPLSLADGITFLSVHIVYKSNQLHPMQQRTSCTLHTEPADTPKTSCKYNKQQNK